MAGRPAAGGGRWVEVDPERLPRWLDGFAQRHGEYRLEPADGPALRLRAADGEVAELFAPPGAPPGAPPAAPAERSAPAEPAEQSAPAAPPGAPDLAAFLAEAVAPRRLGLLLVRRGGFAVGVALGRELVASKTGSRYVQSRTAAGGWSQQRFARRRDNQARAAVDETAEVAARILTGEALDALVAGGDRRLAEEVLADPRLAPLAALRAERFLDVPDPKLAVLRAAAVTARTVRIRLGRFAAAA